MSKVYKHPITGYTYAVNEVGLVRVDDPATGRYGVFDERGNWSEGEIRDKVEGYPTMTAEAFKRRFYEDRHELGELGIAIAGDPDSTGSSEAYSLPADAYYLAPVQLGGDELAALAACLTVLEDRFAYSQPASYEAVKPWATGIGHLRYDLAA